MRVQGSRKRVRLKEADLEPSESRPALRAAPVAALVVWVGSMTLATAIYLDWLPAHSLFSSPNASSIEVPEPAVERSGRVAAHLEPAFPRRQPASALREAPKRSAAAHSPAPEAGATARGSETPESHAGNRSIHIDPADVEMAQESGKTVRGSYHSDNSWAAGW